MQPSYTFVILLEGDFNSKPKHNTANNIPVAQIEKQCQGYEFDDQGMHALMQCKLMYVALDKTANQEYSLLL